MAGPPVPLSKHEEKVIWISTQQMNENKMNKKAINEN